MSRIFVASINELCSADHGNDPEIVARWTANKAPDDLRQWLRNPDLRMIVAEEEKAVVGVGSFSGAMIMTLYVAPSARFGGVSSAMLEHMERSMAENGVTTGRLTSTATAHRFYRDRGWRDSGPPERHFGVASFPMAKVLA